MSKLKLSLVGFMAIVLLACGMQPEEEIPHLRHMEEKRYMLELINTERTKLGIPPVEMGTNNAAQLHAESLFENCVMSYWGTDGLKHGMRYNLAGGEQSIGTTFAGLSYCANSSDGMQPLRDSDVDAFIEIVMNGWMNTFQEGVVLRPYYKKVNIGFVWDSYNVVAYTYFEGNYLDFDSSPAIVNGILSFSGSTKGGARFIAGEGRGVEIYYDPPPHKLTRGQLAHTSCIDPGRPVAVLIWPQGDDSGTSVDEFKTITLQHCPSPYYDIDSQLPPPTSRREAVDLRNRVHLASEPKRRGTHIYQVPLVPAAEWTANTNSFSLVADIQEVLNEHGNGVYTLGIFGDLNGELAPLSEYSIFYGITPPDTYTPKPVGSE